ncbi:ATP-binding protein [Nocardia jejuensis]|uniref:ATP-binding protein n=1 Tax=Nocardia jejuensis TaxID=328049 RepID=UPI00083400CC|nr:ATP-binding protein [Nocardia jejuensis]
MDRSADPATDGGWQLDERARLAEAAAGPSFDLSVCLNEPIHQLGGIQSYGALLALDEAGAVAVASANCQDVLGVSPDSLLGSPIEALIGAEGVAALESTLAAPTGDRGLTVLTVRDAEFDVTVYRSDELRVLEFEPAPSTRPFTFSRFYPSLRATLTRLQDGRGVLEVCATAVSEIRALTGYDRVVAYRFEGRDGPGEVIAESVSERLEPWYGLWFPATDIPPQARTLYERNWIRVIDDVDDATAALVPPVLTHTGRPLDLSDSTLRTVSGFHLEYLRNIEVASSMSVSLLRDGQLWGLIACHGLSPRRLTPEIRSACELFGVMLSLQLAALQDSEFAEARQRARKALSRLVTALDADIGASVSANGELLGELVDADAVALSVDGDTTLVAGAPELVSAELLDTLRRHLPPLGSGKVWSSDCLGDVDPDLARLSPGLCGALVLGVNGTQDLIVWLRRERPTSRTWATDPSIPVRLGPHGERLTPRGSSAVYRATVSGHSLPWTAADVAVAEEFGNAVTEVVLRHSARLAALNAELRRLNDDLHTFAHAAAHELKEPLRGIANSAIFITEDAADDLDPVTVRRLDTIRGLAKRMDELINSLLHFAQLGRAELRRDTLDLRRATEHALEIAGPRLDEQRIVLALPEPGVIVAADPDRLQEVLINLLVNAAKYARAEDPREVAVGAVTQDSGVPAYFVADNGIGIPGSDQKEVLRLFRRLHPRGAHGGGHGAGLAIVERIITRHGGRLWLDSEPGLGTTVWFTLAPEPEQQPASEG